MRPSPLFLVTAKTVLGLLVMAAGAISEASTPPPAPAPAPKPAAMPPRPFRIIDTVCDVADSEISPKGQFVCQYVCRDPDHTKVAVVYSSSGTGQCRTPIDRKIKQYTKDKP